MYIPVAICKMRKLQIQVLTRDGRKNIYETDRSRNVADLKKRIGRSLNVPMAFSRLTYKGRLLTNDSILEDEGVKRMSTLELYWQPLVLTPKQYREKELELGKLDQKHRQTVKKAGHERTPGDLRRTRDHLRVKHSPSAYDIKLSTNSLARQPTDVAIEECVQKQEQEQEQEPSSTSSDELDFLAAYWCCSKSTVRKGRKQLDVDNDVDVDVDPNADLRAEASCDPQSSVAGTSYPHAVLKENELLEDPLGQRCFSCKHQPFRPGVRLTAGRMSRSIISNIRKNQKNCKK